MTTTAEESPSPTDAPVDVIRVQPDSTYRTTISTGEALENTIIDIAATGASFRIEARGGGWAIRNVGIRGQWDRQEKVEPLSVKVASGSTATIRDFYFADGVTDDTYPGVTGIYVKREHAGTLVIDRVNIQEMSDNAIYASTPGYPENNQFGLPAGGSGTVSISNSYAADCLASHFRVGTTGSRVENCVGVGGDRGLWARFGVTIASECDFSGASEGDVSVGAQQWEGSRSATIGLDDCRFDTTTTYWDQNRIVGSSSGSPRRSPPDGVPDTAMDAATTT